MQKQIWIKSKMTETTVVQFNQKGNKSVQSANKKLGVFLKTLERLLTEKSKSTLNSLDGFYYCKTPECDVVYFREKEVLVQKDLSVVVGLKNGANPANMCYCFGWTKKRIKEDIKQNGKSRALDKIKSSMNTIGCACEVKNPSGNCCMADISKFLKEISHKNKYLYGK